MVEEKLTFVPQKPKPIKIDWPIVDAELLYQQSKVKHLYKITGQIKYVNEDLVLSANLAMYSKLLLKANEQQFDLYDYCSDQKYLKSLSQYAQKMGPKLKNWAFYVGVENLYGWKENKGYDVLAAIDDWVSKPFTPTLEGSSDDFLIAFRKAVKQVLNWRSEPLEATVSSDQFCYDIPATGSSGSAFDPGGERMHFEVFGEKFSTYNNKYAKSMVLSVKKKLERLFSNTKQKCNVTIKLEFFPKVRLIVSSDFNTTLKMRFIDTWLQQWLAGNPHSTLWMSKEDNLKMWVDFSKQNKNWNCPMDQTAFDHHISKPMVTIMLEEIKVLMEEKCFGTPREELLQVMDTIIFALDGGTVSWKGTDQTYVREYKNGILSGWQWTAMLDTIANIGIRIVALELCSKKGIKMDSTMFNAQGDDQLAQFTNAVMCLAYWAAISSMGFELHLFKNFFSKDHNEYLRKCSSDSQVNGYPARLLNPLLWLYPGTNLPRDSLERMKQIHSNWQRMAQRLNLNFVSILDIVKKDLKGAKVKITDYDTYLKTSKVRGGAGLLGTGTNKELKTIKMVEEVKVTLDGAGLNEFRLRFGEFQDRELDDWARSVLAIPSVVKIGGEKVEIEKVMRTEIVPAPELKPIPFIFSNVERVKKLKLLEGWTLSEIFGSSDQLINKLYPEFNTYASMCSAPRSWIFELLTDKLKILTPTVFGLNDEFAALYWHQYSGSLTSAMCSKRTRTHNKWDSLQLYAEENFSSFIHGEHSIPRMVG